MFTAITPADCLRYAEDRVAMGCLAKPSVAKQVQLDWEMAHKLDARGDQYKAAGNFKMAQVCYARAFKLADRAHKAQSLIS